MATKKEGQSEHIFVRRVLIVLGLVALLFLLWQLRILFLMLFGAVLIATIFRAVADLICKFTRVPAGVATALSILIVLGAVLGTVVLFGAQVNEQLTTLRETLPAAWKAFEQRVGDMGLGKQLDQLVTSFSRPSGGGSGIATTLMSIGGGLADLVVVIFAGIYLATQAKFYREGLIKLVPPRRREIAEETLLDSDRALRLWLKGQAIAMIVVGLLTGIGLWFLGMPSAFVLGLAAGLLEFIPFAGPIIAAVPALLLALAVSPDLALWVALLYFAIQQFEGNLLSPLVQQYAVDLPGAVLLFSLIGFGTLFGTLGVILAAPLAVVMMVMVKRLYVIETLDTPTPIPGESKS